MTNQETNAANSAVTTLTASFGPTDLTAMVNDASSLPASPCYLVIDPDDDAKREIILFDGVFTAVSLVTSDISNRYGAGSAAGSGITHDSGAKVASIPVAQMWTDINDRVDAVSAAATSDHGALTGLGDDDHTQYALVSGTRTITVSASEPASPATGDLWVDTSA